MLHSTTAASNILFAIILTGLFQNISIGQITSGPSVILIDGNTHIQLAGFNKIRSDISNRWFEIKSGSLDISVSGIIDRWADPKVIITIFAEVVRTNDMVIITGYDTQAIQYKVEGLASGSYSGFYNAEGCFQVNTHFKLIAAEQPSYLLVLPINICLSTEGKVSYNKSFVGDTGYIEYYKTNNKKIQKKKDRRS